MNQGLVRDKFKKEIIIVRGISGRVKDSVPEFLETVKDVTQGRMMCEDLHLTRTVKEHVILCKYLLDLFE